MLFRKKKQDEWKQEISLQAENIGKVLSGQIRDSQEAGKVQSVKIVQQLGTLEERMNELQKLQKRQVQSVEDFLEEEQERTDRGEALRQRVQEAGEREEHLLALVGCFQEQLHLLHQQIVMEFQENDSKASAWEKQFEIAEDCLKRRMRSCALEEVGHEMEVLDFDYHEVLKVIDTVDDGIESRVAEVFNPGYIYCGKVIKKAQVAAYRRIKDGDDNRN